MDKYNKILIKVHDDLKLEDYYIEVIVGGTLRLSKEEINLLAKTLWDYSWEIDGTFLADNDKYFQDWTFNLPRKLMIKEEAKKLLKHLETIFPNRVVIYE